MALPRWRTEPLAALLVVLSACTAAPTPTDPPCFDNGTCTYPDSALTLDWRADSTLDGTPPPSIVPYHGGYGLRFAGAQATRHQLADAAADAVPLAGAFTITAAVRLERRPPREAAIVSRWRLESGGRAFELGLDAWQRPYLSVSGSGEWDAAAAKVVATHQIRYGQDALILATYTPGERLAVYLDGHLVGEVTSAVPNAIFAAATPTLLGNRPGGELWYGFTGIIGQVVVLGGALSDDESRGWALDHDYAGPAPSFPAVRAITGGSAFHWFGYYDKAQVDPTGRYALSLEVGFEGRSPAPGDVVGVGMIDLQDGDRWIPLGETRAWNWQQGAMLQWRPGSDREVLWNDREGDGAAAHFVTRILDVPSGALRTLPRASYHVSPRGDVAVGLDFARLDTMRPGYGYAGVEDPGAGLGAPASSTIYRLDLDTGEAVDLLNLAEIAAIPAVGGDVSGQTHWLNHLQWNPSGTRFLFYNRYAAATGGTLTRVFTAAADGSDPFLLSEDGASHYVWQDDVNILLWTSAHGAGYALYEDHYGFVRLLFRSVDGHQSLLPGGEWMLSDTYPDPAGYRWPFLYHFASDEIVLLGRFYHPRSYGGGEFRVDCHPRSDPTGTRVIIDSPHQGGRQQYLIDIADIVGGG